MNTTINTFVRKGWLFAMAIFSLLATTSPVQAQQAATETGTKLNLLGAAGGTSIKKAHAQPYAGDVVVGEDLMVIESASRRLAWFP